MMTYHMEQPITQNEFDQIFRFIGTLSKEDQSKLVAQVKDIDLKLLIRQKELLSNPQKLNKNFEAFEAYANSGNEEDRQDGFRRIKNGKMGCIILAGGQGTRLNTNAPKGMYEVSIIKQKSLFQLFSEKVLAASKQAGRLLPLAIMTSPLNDEAIKLFFAENKYFGLNPEQVHFFTQGMLPFLNEKGEIFLDTHSSVAKGPNGNGLTLKEFVDSGIWSQWQEQGVKYVNMLPIDNPLADPFDAELLGYHCRKNVDMTSKSIEKTNPQEKIGVFVKDGNAFRVIEYSEFPEEEKTALATDGKLKHRCGSLSLFCFSMDFVKRVSEKEMPLHLAKKTSNYVDGDGQIVQSKAPNIWKFETFIFDVLNYTDRLAALFYSRAECFAPLKNAAGENSLQTVQAALQARDRQIIEGITGIKQPEFAFELAADFYYPTQELIAKWKGKTIPSGYIEP